MNFICVPLISIVVVGGVGAIGLLDDVGDDFFEIFISGMLVEALLKCIFVKILETLHLGTVGHGSQHVNEFFLIFANILEPHTEKELEMLKDVGVHSLHNLQVISSELERCLFEVQVPGRVGEHETEINMDEVSL